MMNDREAKLIVDEVGDELGLSPIERLAVRLVAKHETQYGAGWDAKHVPPRAELGAGSNNMGAVTTFSTVPGTFFVHKDSRFDPETGKVVQYETKFTRHTTPQAGFRELARMLLFRDGQRRANVARALELGSLLELATAMRMNRYFLGVKPLQAAIEDYRSALERRYKEISAVTGETFFSNPKAAPGSREESGSGQASQSSPSVPRFLQQLSGSLPVLRRGARGDLVGVMQFELGGLEPDEFFGPKTEARLIAFQKGAGIASEIAPSGKTYGLGVCGVRTWAALFAVPTEDEDNEESGPVAMRAPWRSVDDQAALELAWREGAQDDDEPTVA